MSGVAWAIRDDEQLGNLVNWLREAPKPYRVKIEPLKSPKTRSQLNYAHSLCGALAEATGVSLEIAKRDAKAEFGVVIVHMSVITGERTARLKSFAEYTSEEMAGFIPAMEVHLDERGIDYVPSNWRDYR